MTDDLEPIAIDDRSGGERMIERGRSGYTRMREIAERQHFDTIALLWMVGVLVIVAGDLYEALRRGAFGGSVIGFSGNWWYKFEILAQYGGGWTFFAVIGIGLAALVASPRARLALWIAVGIGVAAIVAAVAGVAVSWHDFGDFAGSSRPPITDELVASIRYLGYFGLGLVVVLIAWGLLRPYREPAKVG